MIRLHCFRCQTLESLRVLRVIMLLSSGIAFYDRRLFMSLYKRLPILFLLGVTVEEWKLGRLASLKDDSVFLLSGWSGDSSANFTPFERAFGEKISTRLPLTAA